MMKAVADTALTYASNEDFEEVDQQATLDRKGRYLLRRSKRVANPDWLVEALRVANRCRRDPASCHVLRDILLESPLAPLLEKEIEWAEKTSNQDKAKHVVVANIREIIKAARSAPRYHPFTVYDAVLIQNGEGRWILPVTINSDKNRNDVIIYITKAGAPRRR